MRLGPVAGLALALLPGTVPGEEVEAPGQAAERLGYSVGYQIGDDFRRQGVEIDPELVASGLLDALAGENPRLTPEEMRRALTELQQRSVAVGEQQRREQARINRAQGEAFLAANAQKPGVETLPSGLQIQVLAPGAGAPPKATDTVTVHYRGTLTDGTEFDSSHRRGEPARFPLERTIPGWIEGLQRVGPGARLRLFVPPALAYGARGAGDRIGPEATLIFDVELLAVERAP